MSNTEYHFKEYFLKTLNEYVLFAKRHLGVNRKEALELIQNLIAQVIIKEENDTFKKENH